MTTRAVGNPLTSVITVSWYDRRDDPNNLSVHVYTDSSTNGGVSWGTDARITEVASPLSQLAPNFDPLVADCYFGDYNALVAKPGSGTPYIAGWGDTRRTTNGSPDPDIRVAAGC